MGQPIRVHPSNPRCFEFRGKAVALVTATEHYGAVLNRPFRMERYIADVAAKHITVTRLFCLFREQQGYTNPASTAKPASPDYIAPFPRVGPGLAADREPKYDLDQWNPEYFERLHKFLGLASEYGIIVEVVLLSNTYEPVCWGLNPLNPANNINGTPEIKWAEYMSLRHPGLWARQAAHARKIVEETNRYDNIFYEMCNEPGGMPSGGDFATPDEVNEWLTALAGIVRETEKGMENKHIIAGQESFIYEPFSGPHDYAFGEFDVDAVNIHPLPGMEYHGRMYHMGDFMSKQLKLRAMRDFCLATREEKKPLNFDEDNIASQYRDAEGWTIHRKRAWTALMCGCHYDVIDFSIQPWLEDGTEASQAHIRTWMKHLSDFVHSIDIARARTLAGWVKAQPEHTLESVLAVEGEDYGVYLADEREREEAGAGEAIRGEIGFDLPAGKWTVACYSPMTGMYSPAVEVEGGKEVRLELPEFVGDLAVRVTKA